MKKIILKAISSILVFTLVVGSCMISLDTVYVAGKVTPYFSVRYIPVTSGDATLISYYNECTKTIQHILIDCGGKGSEVSDYLDKAGVTSLEAIILTHQHSDHVNGLQYLAKHQHKDKNGKIYSHEILVKKIYAVNIFGYKVKSDKWSKNTIYAETKKYISSYCKTNKKSTGKDANDVIKFNKPLYYTNKDETLVTLKEFLNLTLGLHNGNKNNQSPLLYLYEPSQTSNSSRSITNITEFLKDSNNKLCKNLQVLLYIPSNYFATTKETIKGDTTAYGNNSSMMVQVIDKRTSKPIKYLFGGDVRAHSMFDWMKYFNKNKKKKQEFISHVYKVAHHGRRIDTDTDMGKIATNRKKEQYLVYKNSAAQPSTIDMYSTLTKFRDKKATKPYKYYSVEKSFIKYYVMGYDKKSNTYGYKTWLLFSNKSSNLNKGYQFASKVLIEYCSSISKVLLNKKSNISVSKTAFIDATKSLKVASGMQNLKNISELNCYTNMDLVLKSSK